MVRRRAGRPAPLADRDEHMSTDALPEIPVHDTPPVPGLRERKKRLRTQRILAAARHLFVHQGFQNTTIQDIARDAGIGLGTLYLYARSKEDLLVLVFRETLLDMIDSAYARIPAEVAIVDQVLSFFATHIAWHREHESLARTVLKELSFPGTAQRRDDVRVIMQATYARLTELLGRAQSRGQLAPDMASATVVSSIFGLYFHHLQGFLGGFIDEHAFEQSLRDGLLLFLPDPGKA